MPYFILRPLLGRFWSYLREASISSQEKVFHVHKTSLLNNYVRRGLAKEKRRRRRRRRCWCWRWWWSWMNRESARQNGSILGYMWSRRRETQRCRSGTFRHTACRLLMQSILLNAIFLSSQHLCTSCSVRPIFICSARAKIVAHVKCSTPTNALPLGQGGSCVYSAGPHRKLRLKHKERRRSGEKRRRNSMIREGEYNSWEKARHTRLYSDLFQA